MAVGDTILSQLGGNKFIVMTGAKGFVISNDSLLFSLPRGMAKNGATKARVTLDPSDTYTVAFFRMKKNLELHQISSMSGVFVDNLREVFTENTGLYCTL